MTRRSPGLPAADPAATAVVGSDRYATAAKVATTFFASPTAAGIVTGLNFPDALSAGAMLASVGAPPPGTSDYLGSIRAATAHVFGGDRAVSASVMTAVAAALESG